VSSEDQDHLPPQTSPKHLLENDQPELINVVLTINDCYWTFVLTVDTLTNVVIR